MYEFKFADIGEGIHEGVIHEWLVKEGETVKDGQALFLVETDKVTAEIPSPVDGAIEKINYAVGETIHVGDVAVVIDDGLGHHIEVAPPDEVPHHKESVEEAGSTSVVGEIEVSSVVIPSSFEVSQEKPVAPSSRKVLATPVARKMAKDLGVDITEITGSGTSGRVMKNDISEFARLKNQTNDTKVVQVDDKTDKGIETSGNIERIKMSMLRKTIARNMVQSKFTIPHTAAMDDIDVTALVAYRKALNEKYEERGIKLTFMPFVLKAVALALKEHPIVNSSLDESSDEIVIKHFYNIGIATDTPDGLMVPVLKDVDKIGLLAISQQAKALAEQAKTHTLKLEDMKDGTFTITNYGAVGAKYGVPVIKYPEAAILGIGTIFKAPAVGPSGEVVIQDTLPISISFDHRIVDGADAGRFMQSLKRLLSDPDLLLIS
ncbi:MULTISPECIES: dihydrolipoamide acetyltransferase family protein [unclassified Fusibacter]|uniref:dihydrolipoamide acetyltransferase family protein n=1 Tax=unclassified Fusibacter TaxID=2624464 RepID=UPI001012B915|nr:MULTISPECIES: dihydrolipoamide acetyltransferase family protein [unclassified Fusibacter]MCK8061306.1 2-oxo acid dehydrogenase subunit E2 [Fusibacter sp. A2]NPE23497.1 2-oxo acid dehydrogenase subunit E2 [Fusibacter sp. A1]RXV59103.1 2-oxo acid dehydrogenase subunit E2 [Fusibacter sp. A1]